MVAVILLLLFLVDGFASSEARFIHSYTAAERNHRGLVGTNPGGNDPFLSVKEAVGVKSLPRARRGISKRAKRPSHEHNTEKKQERDMIFHPV